MGFCRKDKWDFVVVGKCRDGKLSWEKSEWDFVEVGFCHGIVNALGGLSVSVKKGRKITETS